MQKITLTEARKLLAKQNLEIQLTYNEAFQERYNVVEDCVCTLMQNNTFKKGYGQGDDELSPISMQKFLETKKEQITNKLMDAFDDNDYAMEIYWDCVKECLEEIFNDNVKKFKYNPFEKEDMEYIEEIIKNRANNDNEFYVLHYDVETSDYLNEIVFTDLKTAVAIFEGSTQINENDRIELIFSPDDEEFGENVVMAWKGKEE